MPTLEFEMTLNAPLAKVWAFYQDPATNLPKLAPPDQPIAIESADQPLREGARIILTMKDPLGRPVRWVSRIVEHRPPHAVVFGEEARFGDEQESGPMASWRHEHELEAVDSKTTRVVDRITYRLPWGPVGWIADILLLRRKIRAVFAWREKATRASLE